MDLITGVAAVRFGIEVNFVTMVCHPTVDE
jgi:hypothetical protein